MRLAFNLAYNLGTAATAINAAVAGREGSIQIPKTRGGTGESIYASVGNANTETVTIPLVTFDGIVASRFAADEKLDVVKIDIEGAEYEVLFSETCVQDPAGYAESMIDFNGASFLHKVFFRARERLSTLVLARMRRWYWSMQGMKVGKGTALPRLLVTWPHQVQIGADCNLEGDTFFKFDGIWRPGPAILIGDRTFIGRACEFNIRKELRIGGKCLIASGVKFVDHDHGIGRHAPMCEQPGPEAAILVEDDVWIGANATILKGVTIGRGCVIAAGAVVTRSIPPFEIWAGVPARKIKERE